jgi:DNA modification methylase/superfamily II DNA or RNA helicase
VSDYTDFLASKQVTVQASGIEVSVDRINPLLFPFQRDMVRWALRKGRAALFEDCGLGKTFQQVEWARLIGVPTLILAPLAVAQQTVREAAKLGVNVQYVRHQRDVRGRIVVTNYEMLDKMDPSTFGAVVLDESSILKNFEGKTRKALIEAFKDTPYRLCCTATPAPNDHTEIANHAEFLGVMTRQEMLATYFVHDDEGWRLKGHAREPFYQWLASWAMALRKPSDLGYADDGYNLPALTIAPVIVASDYVPEGQLFSTGLKGVTDRAKVRRSTLNDRVFRTAQMVNRDKGHQWIIWCGLNEEGHALHRLIEEALIIEGGQTIQQKEERITTFLDGGARVLISKPSIIGHGLNLQCASRMAFVGLSDSYEQYYQAIRRSWRFGQTQPVTAYVVLSDAEEAIYQNIVRKEADADAIARELIANVAEFERAEIRSGRVDSFVYEEKTASGHDWTMHLGDSAERLKELADSSVDLSIFSPPFAQLYTYSASERDLGNGRDYAEFFEHFGFITRELLRVMKPGRNICCHCQQLASHLASDGVIGMKDFRGDLIRHFESQGFVYHGEVCIDKDPQAQAIRTHSKGLLFAQFRKDSSWSRPAFADYIILFRKPGDNPTPIQPDLTNDQWIEYARPIWYGIKESDTLNVVEARSEKDERHICPLQLGTIERCVRLWSNRGELVLSPFGGIGSEGYQSILSGRRFWGCELKPEYWRVAVKNLRQAEQLAKGGDLFSFMGIDVATA